MLFTIQKRIEINKAIKELKFADTWAEIEKQAITGNDPKSLSTLIRALDTAKEYELPLLLGAVEAIITAAPEAYDALKEKEKTVLRRHFFPVENA